jgi:twitching motility protein PilJ
MKKANAAKAIGATSVSQRTQKGKPVGDKVVDTGDDAFITLPFFLGRRTARQFRRIFIGVLAFSLPMVLAISGYQYLEERSFLPKIIASSTMASDMRFLGRAAEVASQGNTTAMDQLSARSASLSESLRLLEADDSLPEWVGVAVVPKERIASIATLVRQAQMAGQRVALAQSNARETKQVANSTAEETTRFAQTLRTTAFFKPTGILSDAETEMWNAIENMAALTKQWGQQLRADNDVAKLVGQMLPQLAAFRQRESAVALALANQRTNAPKDMVASVRAAKLMETAQSIAVLAQDLQTRIDGMKELRGLASQVESGAEQLDAEVRALRDELQQGLHHNSAQWVADMLLRGLLLVAIVGLLYLRFSQQDYAQQQADKLRQNTLLQLQWAEAATQEAKQANETTQLAILRLMQELQDIASGDLTKRATVSEAVTGGIADAVNYTVEELRILVIGVLRTSERVMSTIAQVDATSSVLLESSRSQLSAMRASGQSVVHLAGQVDTISAQAQVSAEVARQSRAAAQSGLDAVQEAINSINTLRDHVHETSKRIKRLGESSQEIGEITALIYGITEQTNTLAVNAAIQAASAGEAGRGFSVVAEEVGQLAERCANAARQITTLVIGIQTDAQNAIGAMERSAQSVVEGTKLSDRAGVALNAINQLSTDVTSRIEKIADTAKQESESAKAIAHGMQNIVGLIEQTSHGTQLNADKVQGLRSAADDLRESVARFNVT